jgi:hypothetical protein
MNILLYAKKTLNFWLGREVDYATPDEVEQEEFVIREIEGRRYLTIRKARSIAQQVIYPDQREENIWHDHAMAKLIKSVEKMFNGGSFFDVCIVNEAVKDFDLQSTPSVAQAIKHLNLIHCTNFNEMSPEVFEAIPRYLTHIFSEGRIPLEATARSGEMVSLEKKPEPQSPEDGSDLAVL